MHHCMLPRGDTSLLPTCSFVTCFQLACPNTLPKSQFVVKILGTCPVVKMSTDEETVCACLLALSRMMRISNNMLLLSKHSYFFCRRRGAPHLEFAAAALCGLQRGRHEHHRRSQRAAVHRAAAKEVWLAAPWCATQHRVTS